MEYHYKYKHLVVVHGVGDQARNETALGFVNELVRALPQGDNYTVEVDNLIESVDPMLGTGTREEGQERAFRPSQFRFVDNKRHIQFIVGFSEVYWQDITNDYLKANDNQLPLPLFTWARSVNTRFLKDPGKYALAMEAIDNLEKLLGLVGRLAAFYKQSEIFVNIVNKFLGDVQMYTESDNLRGLINGRFINVLRRVEKFSEDTRNKYGIQDPEIYIVAHSEGTVVTYNGLVEAMEYSCKVLAEPGKEHEECRRLNMMSFSTGKGTNAVGSEVELEQRLRKQKESAEDVLRWFRQIKGLVTLGSPLDKHYTVWSNRFRGDCLKGMSLDPLRKGEEIPWFNYWDRSDPVGYGLNKLFEPNESKDGSKEPSDATKLFCRKYDLGFSRYPVPGLAHVDYWKDQGIYQNVIHEVMGLVPDQSETVTSKTWVQALHQLDWPLYVLVRLATLGAGVFFLYKLLQPDVLNGLRKAIPAGIVPAGLLSMTADPLDYAIPIIVPLLGLKGLRYWYRKVQGEFQKGLRRTHLMLSVVWVAWVVCLCLVVGESAKMEFKDWLGYWMGLATTACVWMLHGRMHLGLLQMWRYTRGDGTGDEDRLHR